MTPAPIHFETDARLAALRRRWRDRRARRDRRPAHRPAACPGRPALRPDPAILIADFGQPPNPWGAAWLLILALVALQLLAVAANANDLPRRFRPGRSPDRILRLAGPARQANGVRRGIPR